MELTKEGAKGVAHVLQNALDVVKDAAAHDESAASRGALVEQVIASMTKDLAAAIEADQKPAPPPPGENDGRLPGR